MDCNFGWQVQNKAEERQYPGDGRGIRCAKCGNRLLADKLPCHYIARTPVELGGHKNADNCIVVYKDCFELLKVYEGKVITLTELPFYSD